VDSIPANLTSSFKIGELKNGYQFSLAFGILNFDYSTPSDLAKIGYYQVSVEKYVFNNEGVWNAISIPLKHHRCTLNDWENFYKV
jgi:hypothetical protein